MSNNEAALIEVEYEGSGNGVKTVIKNLIPLSKRLGSVHPGYLIKFFGLEWNCQVKYCSTIGLVNGRREVAQLEQMVQQFMNRYVVCGQCQTESCSFRFDDKEAVSIKCERCGNEFKPANDLLIQFMERYPPSLLGRKRLK